MGTKRRRRSASNPIPRADHMRDTTNEDTANPPFSSARSGEQDGGGDVTTEPTAPELDAEYPRFELPDVDGPAPLRELADALKQRRETIGLSVAEVARISHLSPRTVTRLEQEPLDELDAPFYVKNRLRLYVAALRIEPDTVIEFFESVTNAQKNTVTMSQREMQIRALAPWVIGGVVAAAVVSIVIALLW